MNLHLIGFPHTQTTVKNYSQCAYTQKIVRFPAMMNPYGYKTYLYASEDNDSKCEELVKCITKEQQHFFLKDYSWYKEGSYYEIPFDNGLPIWRFFIKNAIKELKSRIQKDDLILITNPIFYRDFVRAFPNHKIVEYTVGYYAVYAPYRVYESDAVRNFSYGQCHVPEHTFANDAVIPNYFNPNDFPLVKKKEDYLLFMARPIPSKGYSWIQILANMGHKIKVAGSKEVEGENIEWVGYVDGKEKAELMGKAKALLSPTFYIEPFGGVVVEAALCGTPSITTDWGIFRESVEDNVTGFRCNKLSEIIESIPKLDKLDSKYIRQRAIEKYSIETVGKKYDDYFKRISKY